MPRWSKLLLVVFAVTIGCFGGLYVYVGWSLRNIDWNIPVYKEFSARDALMLDLSNPECLTRDMVTAQAQARGWGLEDAPSLGQCQSPDDVSDWLRVTTEDGFLLPGNPQNVTYFGFDETNCSVFLPANAGIDANCPDP